MPATVTKGAHRSEEERIRALEAQIERLRRRKAQKLVRRDPSVVQMRAAVRSIDQAMAATTNPTTRKALGEARNTLTACLALTGAMPKQDGGVLMPQAGRSAGGVSEDALLSHVRADPGARGEEIASVFGASADAIRPVMKRLIRAGRVKAAGQARAMSYAAG
jgi:hypothetical protein